MKIEGEYSEIERLKDKVAELTIANKDLKEKLEATDINVLERKAIELSQKLFEKYMLATLKYLGFSVEECAVNFLDIERHLGKRWYSSDKMSVVIGATITNRWRQAFISIGVDMPKKTIQPEEEENLLMTV